MALPGINTGPFPARPQTLRLVGYFQLAALIPVLFFATPSAQAETNKKASPKDFQRPYKHVCAPGTEQFGEEPPKGYRTWCRMPLKRNEYILQGAYTQYYEGGHRKIEGVYDRNKKEGKWITYYPNGRKRSETEYVNGRETKKTIFDGNGKPVDRSKYLARQEEVKKIREKKREQLEWLSKTKRVKFNPHQRSR